MALSAHRCGKTERDGAVEEKAKYENIATQASEDRELLMSEAVRVDALFRNGAISTSIGQFFSDLPPLHSTKRALAPTETLSAVRAKE